MKSILHRDRQNAILVDLLMYTQIFIEISYDSMQISCQQCCHVEWNCDSLLLLLSLNVVSSLSLSIRCKQLIAQEKLIKLKLFWHSLLFYLFIFSQRHISLILHPSKRVVVVTRTQAMVVTRALTIVVTRGTGRSGKWDYFDAKNVWSLIRFFSLFIKY